MTRNLAQNLKDSLTKDSKCKCGHHISMHTLKGHYGPDECHENECECRLYQNGD